MKKLFLVIIVILTTCQCGDKKDILPEYKDWYVLKSPEPRDVQAVYGNIDSTLLIITLTNVYFTKDRGMSWVKAKMPISTAGLFSFASSADTLFVLNGKLTASNGPTILTSDPDYYGVDPLEYSVDGGVNWQIYSRVRARIRISLNKLKTRSGTLYSIDELYTPVTTGATDSYYVETVGIKVSDGRKLDLPQRQQVRSIYFDSKSRLYISGSAPICGALREFAFCGDQNGLIYVSKQSQP
jgi:hypothetical protein